MRKMLVLVAAVLLALLTGAFLTLRAASNTGVRTVSVGAMPLAAAIDARTGHVFVLSRGAESVAGSFSAPAFSSRGFGTGFGLGSVSMIDLRGGTVLRTVQVGPDPRAIAVDQRSERVFVTNDDNASVNVLDALTGAPLQAISVGSRPHAVAVDPVSHRAFVLDTADSAISVLDTSHGTLMRTMAFSATVGLDGALAGTSMDRVYLGAAGAIQVLDARSGKTVRTVAVDPTYEPMVVDAAAQRALLAGSDSVAVLDLRSGQVLRTIAVSGAPSALAIDARRQRIFVAQAGAVDNNGRPVGTGAVTIFDARSGVLLRTVPVGAAPDAIAVDQQTGRAVVVNSGGQARARYAWDWVPQSIRRWAPFLPTPNGTQTVPGSVSIIDAAP